MIDSIRPEHFNPYLGYKLDPGEPGLANSSPASLSILRVAAHEVGNINQFKSQALKKGGIVIYTDIDLNLKKRGGFLAAVGGKSKAVILYKKEIDKNSPQDLHYESQNTERKDNETEDIKQRIEKEIQKITNELRAETDPEKVRKLLNTLQSLEIYKSNSSSLDLEFILGLTLDLTV
ncbi:hypothetical protein [Petrotoga olearia]|uniref:Uncharacterized protein n=2 Tax=Petrotoga olearia TaxID=156203 RepID=A0A2K1P3S1_9BACT|nr:hypothetical protein [Petrotoga olearia]KUK14866.1 MAG: Uncharacterized protein XD53_1710 [Petrotoga mobilis]PNR97411.1 hypothetical protein X929_03230 [Petrotoga olearia DSM 13574]RMA70513.1 hypothetical protein C8D75_1682 [Petrotoga olearia]HBT50937.1 hypothetical protein [Petrotoga sp.]